MRVRLEALASLEALAPLWRDLEGRAGGGFFLSWSWIGPWAALASAPLWLLRVEHEGRVVGLSLWGACVERRRGMKVRRLALHGSGAEEEDAVGIEYNGILAEAGLEAEVWAAGLQGLIEARAPLWDELTASGLAPEQAARFGALGLPLRRLSETRAAHVDLAALRAEGVQDLGGYLGALGKSTREQIRRSLKLYAAQGPLALEAAREPAELLAFWEEMRPHHQARWESRGEPGAFGRPFLVRMQERLLSAASGEAEILRVSAGGVSFGWIYNFLEERPEGRRALFYMGGFAYAGDQRLKPGLVAHALAAERYLRQGFAAYDFMAGDYRYKRNLGMEGPEMVALAVRRRRLLLEMEEAARKGYAAFRSARAAMASRKTASVPETVSSQEKRSA
ncbi:GNAT family N-acetyltransferase [Neomegalonema sp.]|uniref:GNAT family N-acetyltransferase n=1 Tax=Neomegalonema sp. TaxID=2039713 RepID=UPI00260C658A|nr:GNAT family N-acetyltransferase [Neomegalonema sp.]MDD2868121.1 GNAT family N-acetyltransferase [Neomegalonema sp.]